MGHHLAEQVRADGLPALSSRARHVFVSLSRSSPSPEEKLVMSVERAVMSSTFVQCRVLQFDNAKEKSLVRALFTSGLLPSLTICPVSALAQILFNNITSVKTFYGYGTRIKSVSHLIQQSLSDVALGFASSCDIAWVYSAIYGNDL